MADVLYSCAKAFDKMAKNNYLFTVGRSAKKLEIDLSCFIGNFTHIIGLDHLSDIREFSSHSIQIKTSAFQSILSNELSYQHISNSKFFRIPYKNTCNSITNSEYTVTERIIALCNIEDLLDKAYKGKIFRWDCSKTAIRLPNGQTRRSSINADYMLAIPSNRNSNEKIYLFMYEDRHPKNRNHEIIKLNIFSAFPDCVDLSLGQERPFTILKETKINITNKTETLLFIHPSYKQEIHSQAASVNSKEPIIYVLANMEEWADAASIKAKNELDIKSSEKKDKEEKDTYDLTDPVKKSL